VAGPVRPGDFRVAAAIDFGTHSTGYAWVPVDEHNDVAARRDIKFHPAWPDQPVPGVKTLSAVLLADDDAVEAWGYTARKKRGTRSSAARPGRYYQGFKLDLYDGKPGQQQDTPGNRTRLAPARATTVAAAFLHEVVREAVQEIKAGGYSEDEIRWCLTVPTIWDDQAMSRTRQAATQAGLPGDPERLRLVREPEAAALYCMVRGAHLVDTRQQPALAQLSRQSRYIIVDCGGGTVDISAYEVDADHLRQIGDMFGGTFGSEFLNHAFITDVLARRIGGIGKVAELARSHQDVLVELADEWEKAKLTVEVAEEDGAVRVQDQVTVTLGRRVGRKLEEVVPDLSQRLRECQDDDECIVVEPAEVEQIFNGEIGKILAEVDKQLAAVTRHHGAAAAPEKILLVGGFAQSRYLQLKLSLHLKDRATVFVPPHGAQAVLAGAVHSCYDPKLLGARLSRYTYGYEMCPPFEEGIDPEDRRTTSDYHEKALCSGRFERVVGIRESVVDDYEHRTALFPIRRDQSTMSIRLFTSTDPDPRYVPEAAAYGEVTVDISATAGRDLSAAERGVDLVFRFGGAEIAVTATDRATGQAVTKLVPFERSDDFPDDSRSRPWPLAVTGESVLDHDQLAKEYDAIVNQRLASFARNMAGQKRQDVNLERARWIGGACLLLFGEEVLKLNEIYDRLEIHPLGKDAPTIEAIVQAAAKLRAASTQLAWDFTIEMGSWAADGQKLWRGCDPQQPVRFVVAPALLIGGARYRSQQVYTSSKPVLGWRPTARRGRR
jgi:hypothetical protein